MARIRYIKPGFFENDELAVLKPLARLLFIGLWCWADREGRLLDRPTFLKEALLPHDPCSADRLLQSLADAGFVIRYESDGKHLIQIVNWHHQVPHVNEPASRYEAPTGYQPKQRAQNRTKNQSQHHTQHQSQHHTDSGAGTRELGTRNQEPGTGTLVPPPPDGLTRCVRAYDALMGQPACNPHILAEMEKWRDSRIWATPEQAAEWFEQACSEAAKHNGRSLAYVLRILERYSREGVGNRNRDDAAQRSAAEFDAAMRGSG